MLCLTDPGHVFFSDAAIALLVMNANTRGNLFAPNTKLKRSGTTRSMPHPLTSP